MNFSQILRATDVPTRTTRASLIATASRALSCTSVLAGSSLISTQVSNAADWTGGTSADWNEPTNWNTNAVPAGENAIINTTTPNIATISADLAATPVDIIVGTGATSNGRLDHTAGNAATGNQNWMFVGRNGGTGVYNLADTSVAGGGLTGFGTGSGSIQAGGPGPGGRLYIGGFDGAVGSNGKVNVNTTGTLTVNTQLQVGTNGSVGELYVDAGTITTGDATAFGNGSGSTGRLFMAGGSITKSGGGNFSVGLAGGIGEVTQNAGDINVAAGEFWVGNGSGSQGTYNFDGGTISVNNWIPIGRDSGTGIFHMSGGTITKTGAGSFTIGTLGTDSNGIVSISGGLLDIQSGNLIVGEGGTTSTAQFTLSNTGQVNAPLFEVGRGGSSTGTVSLEGGTLNTGRIFGGAGVENVTFNGTQIQATVDQPLFISDLDNATVDTGGLLVNSAGFTLTAPQPLTGTGGVVKSGAGTLRLSGDNSLDGPLAVNEGVLAVAAGFDNGSVVTGTYGAASVADGAGLGVIVVFSGDQVTLPSATFGTSASTSFGIDLGSSSTPSTAPLNVLGELAANADVTVNLSHEFPEVGSYTIVSSGSRSGTGTFVLGTMPEGVNATITDNGTEVILEITSIDRLVWDGDESGAWDFTTENWFRFGSTTPATYSDGLPVLFNDDLAFTGTPDVTLNIAAEPTDVLFNNVFTDYTISGTGSINGTGGVVKQGSGNATLGTSNGYTGATTIENGRLIIDSVTDAGVAGPLGAAAANSANLNLSGGILQITGAASSTDRGFSILGENGGIDNASAVTFGGQIVSDDGNFIKSGSGDLILTGTAPNTFGENTAVGFRHNGGTLRLEPGTETTINGEFRPANVAASVAGIAATDATLTSAGPFLVGEGEGSSFNMEINGTSAVTTAGQFLLAIGTDSTADVTINGSGSLTLGAGWLAIGNSANGVGTMTVNDSGTLTTPADFNVGDVGQAQGTLNLNGSAVVNSNGATFIGKAAECVGVVEQTGGTFNAAALMFVGSNGNGTWDLSAGTVNAGTWMAIGRFPGSSGVVNASGDGTINIPSPAGQTLYVGEEGAGILNISGDAVISCAGPQVRLSRTSVSSGIINLYGGTLIAKAVSEFDGVTAGGSSTFNFNGGILQADAAPAIDFMSTLDTATVQSGGARIDSNGADIEIAQNLLNGGGGLTKLGAGRLTLSGQNEYAGTTTVSSGTLSLTNPVLVDGSSVVIATGGVLDLPHGLVDTVAGLTIDGNPLGDGIYDSTTHPGFITGTGQLEVSSTAGTPFDTWATDNGLTVGVNDGPEQDPDKDGIANVLEYILGGNPLASDTGILPDLAVDPNTVVLTFSRSDDSEVDTTQTFQFGTDLQSWTDVNIGASDSGPDANGVTVTVDEQGTDPDLITVSVPRTNAVDGRLFVRLQATKP